MPTLKKAFTLAEVLITLGIIGVVAALTIPVLVKDYQKRELRSSFLKTYRNITTVIGKIQDDHGSAYDCYNNGGAYITTDCADFWQDFLAGFHFVKNCTWDSAGCNPKYKTKTQAIASGAKTTNKYCSFDWYHDNDVHYLVDGSAIYKSSTISGQGGVFFAVDVNGNRGPNKWGYDLFYMTLDGSKGQVRLTDSVCALWETGGRRVKNMLLDTDDVSFDWQG